MSTTATNPLAELKPYQRELLEREKRWMLAKPRVPAGLPYIVELGSDLGDESSVPIEAAHLPFSPYGLGKGAWVKYVTVDGRGEWQTGPTKDQMERYWCPFSGWQWLGHRQQWQQAKEAAARPAQAIVDEHAATIANLRAALTTIRAEAARLWDATAGLPDCGLIHRVAEAALAE
jgi:hypothetical protein